MESIRVLMVDDHPVMRVGVTTLVSNESDMELVGEASNAKEAIAQYRSLQPDVVLMDLRLPGSDGVAALTSIRSEFPEAKVIILTTFAGDAEMHRSLAAGARGYLLKSMPPGELIGAIRSVHAGKKRIPAAVAAQIAEHLGDEPLSAREVEVLSQVAEGRRNQDIATSLLISEETVKVHVKHLMGKLGARDRTEAVSIAVRRGILHLT